ncbi:hypothetical protein BvCmsKKP043_03452 [Escherichia coli]|nr:hypothetical protein BvCmsKKP043_03452 [Escherichia coli]
MKKIGVAGLQREQIKKTIEATAPGSFEVSFTTTWKRQ